MNIHYSFSRNLGTSVPLQIKFDVVNSVQPGLGKVLKVDFSQRLHNRGTDFHIYSTAGYQPDVGDTMLFALVMSELSDMPVEITKVLGLSLQIAFNGTISAEVLQQRLIDVLKNWNVEFTVVQ